MKFLADMLDEDFVLHLFKVDYHPTVLDTAATFAAMEADFSGYSSVTLSKSGWSAPAIDGVSGAAIVTYPVQTWTCGAIGNLIYGYYITGVTSGLLRWVERLPEPLTMDTTDEISVTPELTFFSRRAT